MLPRLPIISTFSVIAACMMLSACFTTTSSTATKSTSELDIAIQGIVDNTVLPSLATFVEETNELASLSHSFCSSNNPMSSDIVELQNQWITTNNTWYELSPYLFGPLTTADFLTAEAYWYIDSYHQRGNDYTSTIRSDITSMISSTDDLDSSTFSSKRFNQTGLLSLEILLFETTNDHSQPQSQSIEEILDEYQNTPRKCDILTGQADELSRRVNVIDLAWNHDYRDTGQSYRDLLVNKLLEDTFTDTNDIDGTGTPAFTRLVVSAQTHLDFLNKRHVTTESAQLSNSIWQALEHTHATLDEALNGSTESEITLYQMMGNGYSANKTTLQENMDSFKSSIEEENTIDFVSITAALDGNFKRELPDALGAELGLNFTDGD